MKRGWEQMNMHQKPQYNSAHPTQWRTSSEFDLVLSSSAYPQDHQDSAETYQFLAAVASTQEAHLLPASHHQHPTVNIRRLVTACEI
jgi:hypothetical protein